MSRSVPPADPALLSPPALVALVERLQAENAELKQTVEALREEIARLKGLKGRPKIQPSGMDKATEPAPDPAHRGPKTRAKGSKTARLTIHEDRVVKAEVPAGSRFKGYEDFIVQDVIVRPHVIRFRRERWLTPDGRTAVAPLPAGIRGHFGPELQRLVLMLYHSGQTTVPRLERLLTALGLDISKRQILRLLSDGTQTFRQESGAVLHAGLETARWITVDDTGARHQGRNGTCTQIGNDLFTWFGTTGAKSRQNFLELLRAGHTDYRINAEALAYLRHRHLAGPLIERLAEHPDKHFADAEAWQAHLERLAIPHRRHAMDPVRLATEGALWGSIVAHGLLQDVVIVSDDAGQFHVGEHALCWVHGERLVHGLDTFNDRQRAAQHKVQAEIWRFYRLLKAWRRHPSPRRRAVLERRFDRIFQQKTGFVTLDRLLERQHANKPELLKVLERPDIPLHTNGSENDIRAQVTRRKVSAGTRSDLGRDCRDAFLGLMKTCHKLGVAFWDYLGDRLKVPDAGAVPFLPEIIRQRAGDA